MNDMIIILNFLTNPIVLAIATIGGFILAIFFYIFPLTNKRLTYGIVSSTAIVTVDSKEGLTTELDKNLEIKYDSTPIANVYVTLIRVRNAGYIDIKEEPNNPSIIFTFEPRILACGSIKEGSETGDARLRIENENSVCLSSLLLDKKDQFLFRVLSEQRITKFKKVEPGSSILRYKPRIRRELPDKRWLTAVKMCSYVLPGIIFLLSLLLYFYTFLNDSNLLFLILCLIFLSIIYISLLIYLITSTFVRKITRNIYEN